MRTCFAILLIGAAVAGGCGAGPESPCAVIPADRLPAGWSLLPAGEMPPICKTPWWVRNPQVVTGPAVRQIEILPGRPTTASSLRAAIYGKGDDRVVVFCFRYPSPAQAAAERRAIVEAEPTPEMRFGLAKGSPSTLVGMHVPESCSGREFFLSWFRSAVEPE